VVTKYLGSFTKACISIKFVTFICREIAHYNTKPIITIGRKKHHVKVEFQPEMKNDTIEV
jgi:hypothetical protein